MAQVNDGRTGVGAALSVSQTGTQTSGETHNNDELLGAWKLVSCVQQWSGGRVTHPYGQNPSGLLVYDAAGHFSGQIQGEDRPSFESGNLLRGTPEEIKAAFEGYVAYYGTYDVDEAAGRLTHHVQGSWFPNWVGEDQTRLYGIADGKLTLTTLPFVGKRNQVTLTLVWERSR